MEQKTISLSIDDETLKKLDTIAKEAQRSRSGMVRYLIEKAVRDEKNAD